MKNELNMLFLVGCDLVYPRIPKIALRCPCYLIRSRVWQNLLATEIAGLFFSSVARNNSYIILIFLHAEEHLNNDYFITKITLF